MSIQADLAQAEADYKQAVADIWAAYDPPVDPPIDPPVDPPVDPPIDPPLDPAFTAVAPWGTVTLLGSSWTAHSGTPDGVAVSADQQVKFHAKSGEYASFDQPRKIRAELCNTKTWPKDVPIPLKGKVTINPNINIKNSEWCSIVQIHQADTRRADGTPVASSPMFSMEVLPKDGGYIFQVRAETGLGVPAPNVWPPYRVLGTVPVSIGVEHTFEIEVIDGHGYDGSVEVLLDGHPFVSFSGPTGFEYVDLLQDAYLVQGKPQSNESYLKMGVYAGKGSGETAPEDVYVEYHFRF